MLPNLPLSFRVSCFFPLKVETLQPHFYVSIKPSFLSLCFHLQSTVVVEKSIQDLMSLMQDLSAYDNQFLEMVCDKLKEYKEICNTAYR